MRLVGISRLGSDPARDGRCGAVISAAACLFDALMAFPPFQAFNARRIYEVYRGPWLAVAALGLALFLL